MVVDCSKMVELAAASVPDAVVADAVALTAGTPKTETVEDDGMAGVEEAPNNDGVDAVIAGAPNTDIVEEETVDVTAGAPKTVLDSVAVVAAEVVEAMVKAVVEPELTGLVGDEAPNRFKAAVFDEAGPKMEEPEGEAAPVEEEAV